MTSMSDKPPEPSAWLWEQIAERLGPEQAQELKAGYHETHRVYQRWRRRLGTPIPIDEDMPPGRRTAQARTPNAEQRKEAI